MCLFRHYNVYYPGDFLMWRSTAPGVTAEVCLSISAFSYTYCHHFNYSTFAKTSRCCVM